MRRRALLALRLLSATALAAGGVTLARSMQRLATSLGGRAVVLA